MPPTSKQTEAKAEQAKAAETKAESAQAEGNTGGETPVPLSQSENLGKQPTTTVGDKEFDDLPSDTQMALKSLASQATSVDSQGVERVVDRYVDGWEPAPVEPDADEVARLEQAHEALDAHREARQKLLGIRGDGSTEPTAADKLNAKALQGSTGSRREREEANA